MRQSYKGIKEQEDRYDTNGKLYLSISYDMQKIAAGQTNGNITIKSQTRYDYEGEQVSRQVYRANYNGQGSYRVEGVKYAQGGVEQYEVSYKYTGTYLTEAVTKKAGQVLSTETVSLSNNNTQAVLSVRYGSDVYTFNASRDSATRKWALTSGSRVQAFFGARRLSASEQLSATAASQLFSTMAASIYKGSGEGAVFMIQESIEGKMSVKAWG